MEASFIFNFRTQVWPSVPLKPKSLISILNLNSPTMGVVNLMAFIFIMAIVCLLMFGIPNRKGSEIGTNYV